MLIATLLPILLIAIFAALGLYILYLVIRIAVRNGILDAQRISRTQSGGTPEAPPAQPHTFTANTPE